MINCCLPCTDSDVDEALWYKIAHVFCPLRLPEAGDNDPLSNDSALSEAVYASALAYTERLSAAEQLQWKHIVGMLRSFSDAIAFEALDETLVISQLQSMSVGDVRAYFIRAQNAAVIFRKFENETFAESFEVSPCAKEVMDTRGKLVCSYPGPAIAVPNKVFGDPLFASELAHFLSQMNSDHLRAASGPGSTVIKEGDTTHPRYITELLTGILRGVGRPVDIQRISKRIGDDVVYSYSPDEVDRGYIKKLLTDIVQSVSDIVERIGDIEWIDDIAERLGDIVEWIGDIVEGIVEGIGDIEWISDIAERISDLADYFIKDNSNSRPPWRRSPLWLIIRVAIQTTLKRDALDQNLYKTFMLFFMNQLAQKAMQHDMSNDVLQWTVAKISRRLTKLGESAPEWLSNTVLETCTCIRTLLDTRWDQVQAAVTVAPLWEPSTLDFSADARLSMHCSSQYIRRALSGVHSIRLSSAFKPERHVRGTLVDFLSADGNFFRVAYAREPILTLYDVEREVSQGIDQWVKDISPSCIDSASERLQLLEGGYSTVALKTYRGNPEAISRMFLTVIELWIALDKLVTRQIPILADYSPEVSTSFLERLLLRHPEDLRRFRIAFRYIRDRHSAAMNSVFSDQVDSESFAVRYYNQSSELKALKCRIIKDANIARTKKRKELDTSNTLYAQLQEWAARAEHEHNPIGANHAKKPCRRCRLEQRMKNMKINVHEWPLPEDSCRAASIVFELKCPVAFNMWRSTIFHLIDICSPPTTRVKPSITLDDCSDLRSYYTKHPRSRITLASDTKPFTKSHYHVIDIPAEESKVFVNNGLDFYYFDASISIRASDAFTSIDTSSLCSYHLDPGPYQSLQQYLQATNHTSNDVICSSADYHTDLFVHEFIAFGHLRSGPFLQWMNILREVRANTLSFRRSEVHMLLAQAAGQVGPCSNTGELLWHHELECPSFRRSLLTELENFVAVVSDNWLEGMTMNTVIFLVSRLLAVSPNAEDAIDTTQQACQLLRTARDKTFGWVLELLEMLENTTENKVDLQSRLCDMAAICRSTFDVGELKVAKQLLDSPGAIEVLLSCAFIIHDNTPAKLGSLNNMSKLLLERDRHLSWRLQHVISDIIKQGNEGVDLAVKRIWPIYSEGSRKHPWLMYYRGTRYSKDRRASCSWFTTRTVGSKGQRALQVSFDIFNGSLVVDGKAVRRLPRIIQNNSLFRDIFPDQVPDVMPSDMDGMTYATRDLIFGHRVYFRMAGDKLTIRAKAQDILELVPPGRLQSDIPAVLVVNHAHWLNLTTWSIEVRPLAEVWQSSPDNWHIQFSPGCHFMKTGCHSMKKGQTTLLDIRSPSWKMISSRLEPLEVPQNLIVTVNPGRDAPEVTVELPRYGLTFFINSHGELESRNLRDMVYDDTQSMGTMIGLVNRLVLRPKLNMAHEQRYVLIPEGDVYSKRQGRHVEVLVTIPDSPGMRMTYQTFRIDTDLGCLTGNVSLANKLYQAYLHALTSNPCSVDPLTKKTGTEEALSILRSAACRSFMMIDDRSAKLLCKIASLASQRKWNRYKSVQRVQWGFLPAASRHHDFYFHCLSIVKIQQSLQLFQHGDHKSPSHLEDFPEREEHLLHRASLRAASLYPPELREPLLGVSHDTTYRARDLLQPATGEIRAYGAALAVYSWFPQKLPLVDIYSSLEQATRPLEWRIGLTISLRYSKKWLSPNLSDLWLQMCDMCRQGHLQQHRFRLLFSLPAMAYSSPHLDDVVHALVAFAVAPRIELEHLPAHFQGILGQNLVSPDELQYTFTPGTQSFPQTGYETAMSDLFSRPTPTLPPGGRIITAPIQISSVSGSEKLRQLIDTVRRKSTNSFQVKYVDDLHQSEKLYGNTLLSVPQAPKDPNIFEAHFDESKEGYAQCFHILANSLRPRTKSECAVNASGQWPRITPKALLSCIASTSLITVPPLWRDCLVSLAKFGLEYQRARRMLLLAMRHRWKELCKEMANTGCDGWEAKLYPDWLLIQLEGDFLIRGIQADVAVEMITPQLGRNTSLQLHMGEGKSSVIIPMAALVLANGDQLARVVIPKALTTQMFQLLVGRLGGLTNRRIYHLPFSRSLKLDQPSVKALLGMLKECKRERGILVAQPDHILSFKLMTIETQFDEGESISAQLLKTQRWLDSNVRDILDECDEILHVRNQLVYTIGSKQHLQCFPERWTSAQRILGVVKNHATSLQTRFTRGVIFEPCPRGAFPHIHILHHEIGKELICRIAQDIMDGLLPNCSFSRAPENIRGAIFNFLTLMDIASSEVQTVQNYTGGAHTWTSLLHLRGLLAHGILLFALKERRWRVDYGLAPQRTMLAVPYRAKDVPAPRAEFGQPDVAVVLTCLSYYYQGLTEEQLMTCITTLLQQDDPTEEYGAWVGDLSLVPSAPRHVSEINIESSKQWREHLVPMFSHNKVTIDYYLSQVVFPKEAKEFPSKLSSSSWDLAEERAHIVTGFSGTNDGRYLLPTSITQRDLDHQRESNARVLTYLLQPENNAYMTMSSTNGERRTACQFLDLVVEQKPEIRVILDVGAQVLELQNHEFAVAWLKAKPDSAAAVYFDRDDELTVLTRDGITQLLLESSFAHCLDECVVYLDDAHTRGTDIKFPNDFRAAVTLGPKVTKDRLTQGCMRMRKLGSDHSVMFFAPLDVDRSIRTIASKNESDAIHTMDILEWAMVATCTEIENRTSLWAQQGVDHALRYESWSKFNNREISSNELRAVWSQPDAKTLEQLYAPASPRDIATISISDIRQRCLDLGLTSLDPNVDAEQEREIVHEVERELEVKQFPKPTPAMHQVTQDIRHFVHGAFVSLLPPTFRRAFGSAVIGSIYHEDTLAWGQNLFVTADFCTIVDGGQPGECLRPVNWILSRISPSGPIFVILSPFEVNELLPEIRISKYVRLHMYTPRTHKALQSCDDLDLYSIPAVPCNWIAPTALVDLLNLFAGQLYLHDYMTYIRVCRYLGVYAKDLNREGYEVHSDGFIEPVHRPLRAQTMGGFLRSPLPLLRHLIGLRRMGLQVAHTHMGKILDGRLLREEDFLN